MYTSRKRQRNAKRNQKESAHLVTDQQQSSNPSKRHRERLNCELESVASLLPFETSVISRLDKLSVLRLAVSFLRTKALFQGFLQNVLDCCEMSPCSLPPTVGSPYYFQNGALLFNQQYRNSVFVQNPKVNVIAGLTEEECNLKALGGFIMIISREGEIVYCTPNVETYLGFHQSDILHQPVFEMVHSEDREEMRRLLHWMPDQYAPDPQLQNYVGDPVDEERQASARFRCFLDNTCGFLRINVKGKMILTDAQQFSPYYWTTFGVTVGTVLGALCVPYVLPMYAEGPSEDHFLRSKHSLDFRLCSMDAKMAAVLEYTSPVESPTDSATTTSFYSFVHPSDLPLVGEAHKQVVKQGIAGILVYRIISCISEKYYWLQSSCRLQNKNGKSDSIICSHRILTECEGLALLEERKTLQNRSNWQTTILDRTNCDQMAPDACSATNMILESAAEQSERILENLIGLENKYYHLTDVDKTIKIKNEQRHYRTECHVETIFDQHCYDFYKGSCDCSSHGRAISIL